MNDKPETAARPDAGSATKPSEQTDEGPSTVQQRSQRAVA